MRICINYWGQNRNIEALNKTYFEAIINGETEHEITIVWTTWDDENTSNFLPDAKIYKISHPTSSELEKYINLNIDDSNNYRKTIQHYLLGLYVKRESIHAIEDAAAGEAFDIIVHVRPDIYITNGCLREFYDLVSNGVCCVAEHYKFDIYKEGGLPDTFFMTTQADARSVLSQLDFLEFCCLEGTTSIHPETAFGKYLRHQGFVIKEIPITAFPQLT